MTNQEKITKNTLDKAVEMTLNHIARYGKRDAKRGLYDYCNINEYQKNLIWERTMKKLLCE